ncbi:bifunctional adenosylcobinamide kinase/adenosylcobinamide-phosphate guanylyltransferase [Streptomyces sp. 7-21]|uniref:bifunctional adenosylcobinamide kinase/adenosylcobinamide-phosphate guanylyltransferase n=1 Tax=Streptomyces sp. 7-21 TaxID=2802283 RepID=UPI00191FD491|nr:bifunctional adenosylcobinamide kinase/adenosylcobinamide-phosphate guanylyltransferase [Streptomyces sp. 7-21]MBL1066709.1 bifunctional adenosylcobinamide kinase/adenosylcobinamide-phosphate guanylyltransferase [Streptomyces sp. 7-21]
MDITLLGTGAPGGLPRPGCPCAPCARALGEHARTPACVLVDDVLLLDLAPGAVLSAARAGRSLHGVRQLLLSHPHAGGAAAHVPPGLPAPVRVPPGGDLALLSGHRVRALAVDGEGTGYAVTGPDGDRLLYLPPGAAPAARDGYGPPFDVCLLDVTGRPDGLAALRAWGAVTPMTDVLAVHLDHDVPPGAETRRRLAAAGARAEPDGTTLRAADYRPPPEPPRRTLVLGGARSGKSAEAERRLAAYPGVVYVATAGRGDGDPEWAARIEAHRARRPAGWSTVETTDLEPLLADADGPPLLVDCLTLWLTRVMDAAGAWDDERWEHGAAARLAARTAALAAAVRDSRRTMVLVSNEAGSGVVPATASGRRFRDELGRLNAAVAAECEQVLLVTAGVVCPLRT